MSKLMSENFSNETYEKTFSQLQMLGKGSFGSVWSVSLFTKLISFMTRFVVTSICLII